MQNLKLTVLLLLVCACAAQAATSPAAAEARRIEQALSATIQKVVPAYVFIGGGSGVVISEDGLMLTNDHVAGSQKQWLVRIGKNTYKADVLGTDPQGDITLLKIQDAKGLPYVEFADSDKLVVGQQVIAVGNPFNTAEAIGDPTVTTGIISAVHCFQGSYSDAIQTDAPINPGNSGGPLLTYDGKLAGINGRINFRFGAKANTGIGLAIPVNQIQRFIPALKAAKGGRVFHGLIRGLIGDMEDADGVQGGADIKDVQAGTVAEKIGLQKGDRITFVEGYKLMNFARYLGVIGTYPAGTELNIKYERQGKTLSTRATLESLNPGSFGVTFKRPKAATEAVCVDKILPKLAAELGGLKSGDVLVSWDGKAVQNWMDWMKVAATAQILAGDKIALKIKRTEDGKEQELEITLTANSRFDEPANAQQ